MSTAASRFFTGKTQTIATTTITAGGIEHGSFTMREKDWAALAQEQERINGLSNGEAMIAIRDAARELHAEYRQYDGEFDGGTLGIATTRIRYKGGDIEAGDRLLLRDRCGDEWTAFHLRTGSDKAITYGIRRIEGSEGW